MYRWILALGLAVGLPAQAAMPASPPLPSEPMQTSGLLVLPPELRAQFRTYMAGAQSSQLGTLERLVEFIFSPTGIGLRYEPRATLSVREAYQARAVNCLSFTLMVVALGREAGLDAYGQEVEGIVSWDQVGSLVQRTGHVNAGVRIGPRHYSVEVGQQSFVLRQRPRPATDDRLTVLFHNNRAAELVDVDLAGALRHAQAALRIDPTHAPSWSNAGLLQARRGDLHAARLSYEKALLLDPRHAQSLLNMVSLHRRMGNERAAADYMRKLEQARLADPFHHYRLAVEREREQNYRAAIRHLEDAIRLHGAEHRFHFHLGRLYYLLQQPERAKSAFERAHQLSRGDTRTRYLAKLEMLQQGERVIQ